MCNEKPLCKIENEIGAERLSTILEEVTRVVSEVANETQQALMLSVMRTLDVEEFVVTGDVAERAADDMDLKNFEVTMTEDMEKDTLTFSYKRIANNTPEEAFAQFFKQMFGE